MNQNAEERDIPPGVRKRNTLQRSLVLDAVRRLANHPSAEEVYGQTARLHPEISKATVYRNLNVLAAEGVLRRISVANAADRFDHNTEKHYHLKCTCCGKFSDISIPYMEDLDSEVERATGYTLSSHAIIFEGLCPACKNRLQQSEIKN